MSKVHSLREFRFWVLSNKQNLTDEVPLTFKLLKKSKSVDHQHYRNGVRTLIILYRILPLVDSEGAVLEDTVAR